jgi:cation transport ATPase
MESDSRAKEETTRAEQGNQTKHKDKSTRTKAQEQKHKKKSTRTKHKNKAQRLQHKPSATWHATHLLALFILSILSILSGSCGFIALRRTCLPRKVRRTRFHPALSVVRGEELTSALFRALRGKSTTTRRCLIGPPGARNGCGHPPSGASPEMTGYRTL